LAKRAAERMTNIENAYGRFSKQRFPLPTEPQVSALEELIGVVLPNEYRQFVLQYNGGYFKCPEITPVGEGCPVSNLHVMYGIGTGQERAELAKPLDLALFDDNTPPKIVPVGYTGTGGLIILDIAPGDGNGVIYLKKEFGDFFYLTDGIEAFFALLREAA
jgi:hypothetical protein